MPLTKVKETGAWLIGGKFMKLFRDLDCYAPDMDIVCEEFEVLYKCS